MEPKATSDPRISEKVNAAEVDGEIVLIDPDSEEFIGLNKVGSFVWKSLENGLAIEEIVAKLEREYGNGTIREDVSRFVEKMRGRNLLVG